jgi:polyisoprenoid-binding protein YceI
MRKNKLASTSPFYFTALATSILFYGVNGMTATSPAPAQPTCQFAVDATQAKLEWTAYKTTEKLGVTAGFQSVQYQFPKAGKSIASLLQGASASIDSLSVESGNPIRNENLKKAFFGLLKNKGKMVAKITQVKGTDEAGTAEVNLSFNQKKKTVPMTYTVENGTLTASGAIDVLDFNGSKALKALNELCYDLHKGKDGVSKTWSEVALKVSVPVTKNCQ